MSGAKMFPAFDFDESWGLVMAYPGQPLEVTRDGQNIQNFKIGYPNPDVTKGLCGCLVIVDENRLILTGAGARNGEPWTGADRVFMFDRRRYSWRELANMRTGRLAQNCGVIREVREEVEVVVAGGYRHGRPMSSVEIYSVKKNEWRQGNLNK